MNLADLREKRNKALADASAVQAAGDFTSETRTKFDAFIAEADQATADIARAERTASFDAEQRSRATNRPNPGSPEERSAEVRSSFRNYLQTGAIETRDLTVAGQGVMIPTIFKSDIISAQKSYGQVWSLVNKMNTSTGDPIRLPMDNDTGNGLIPVTVGTDAPEVDPAMTNVTVSVEPYSTGMVRVDNGLLQDAGFDLESWLRDKFAARFYRGVANLIMAGSPSGVTQSLTAGYASGNITGTAVNKLTYADLLSLMTTLDPAYQPGGVFAVSNNGIASVLGVVDNNGRPIFLPYDSGASSEFIGTILGRPVKLITQLPSVATGNTAVLFGDFAQAYTLRQVGEGLGILRLNERYAAGFETGFIGFTRLGGVVTNPGVPALVGLTIK